MATPVGHSIIGYALARGAGVETRMGLALSVGLASLPDVDFLLGYVANGNLRSLHHETITHRRIFPLLVGAGTGLAAAGLALLRGRPPTPREVLRPALLATVLVGSHLAMDPLPLPYHSASPQSDSIWQVVAVQAWNAVIDMAVYGGLAMAALGQDEQAVRRSG